jgi:hypothetical protein
MENINLSRNNVFNFFILHFCLVFIRFYLPSSKCQYGLTSMIEGDITYPKYSLNHIYTALIFCYQSITLLNLFDKFCILIR